MALQVTRGLFRLWLILSVLWIGGVGVVTWYRLPVYEDWGGIPLEQKDEPGPGGTTAPTFNPNEYLTFKVAEERRAAIWFASAVALVPPIFVLALGSALVWAFRGFR